MDKDRRSKSNNHGGAQGSDSGNPWTPRDYASNPMDPIDNPYSYDLPQ